METQKVEHGNVIVYFTHVTYLKDKFKNFKPQLYFKS